MIELEDGDFEIVEPRRRWSLSVPIAAVVFAVGLTIGLAFDPAVHRVVASAWEVSLRALDSAHTLDGDRAQVAVATEHDAVVAWPPDSTSWASWQPAAVNTDWGARNQSARGSRGARSGPAMRAAPRRDAHVAQPVPRAVWQPSPVARAAASARPPRDDDEAAAKAARDARKALQTALK